MLHSLRLRRFMMVFLVDSLSYENMMKIINLKRALFFVFDSLEYPFDLRYMRHINSIAQSNLIRKQV